MSDNITRPADTCEDPQELRGRINLAISLLEHRAPDETTRLLALEALYGVALDGLVNFAQALGEINALTGGR